MRLWSLASILARGSLSAIGPASFRTKSPGGQQLTVRTASGSQTPVAFGGSTGGSNSAIATDPSNGFLDEKAPHPVALAESTPDGGHAPTRAW